MKTILILTVILLFSACSSTGSKSVDKLYYRFPVTTNTPIDNNLIIARPTAMGILGNRPMVAQDANGGLQQMRHNFWLDSPKVLLQNYLNKVFVQSQSPAENKLFTQILSLEKKGASSVLAIKFTILDNSKNQIFTKTYRTEETLSQNDIPTFVESISSSLENMILNLSTDIQ